jgi:hypothetical protein
MPTARLPDGREVDTGSEDWRRDHDRLMADVVMVPLVGCWLWTGALSDSGYGSVWLRGRVMGAHRAFYTLLVGAIPPGQHVCHRCDTRACVNPYHLFLGSRSDNMRDSAEKGRMGHRTAKLTYEQALEVKASTKRGVDLARRFGVSENVICNIRAGRYYGRPHALRRPA